MLHAMQSVADRSKAGIPEACESLAGPSLNENFNVCHRGALSARLLRLRHSHAQQMPVLQAQAALGFFFAALLLCLAFSLHVKIDRALA